MNSKATDYTFNPQGPGAKFWNDENNWLPVGIPGESDNVTIVGNCIVRTDVVVNDLNIGEGSVAGQIVVMNGGSLTITGIISSDNAQCSFTNTGDGSVKITNDANYSVDAEGNVTFNNSLISGVASGGNVSIVVVDSETGEEKEVEVNSDGTIGEDVPAGPTVKYTLSFIDYNGDVISSEKYAVGESIVIPANPSRAGYDFMGWDPEISILVMPDHDVTCQALYEPIVYTLTFKVDDNVEHNIVKSQPFGSDIEYPANPIRVGYSFKGWRESEDYDGTTIPARNLSYTAEFEINRWTLAFVDYDDNVISETADVEYGTLITLPSSPERIGYTFIGWEGYVEGATMPDADVTYKAVYSVITHYAIFVDYDGTEISRESIAFGADINMPAAEPNRIGHSFKEWYSTYEGTTMPDEDVVYTAVYEANKHTLTFVDYDGESVLGESLVEYGTTIVLPSDPMRRGYTFVGWTGYVADATMPDEDVVYIAAYEVNKYTLTFADYNGRVIRTDDVEYGAPIVAPSNPSRDGYFFKGWSPALAVVMPDEDLSYVATYDLTTYIYGGNGGNWSVATTWFWDEGLSRPSGRIPAANDYVVIPSGHTVVLNGNTANALSGLDVRNGATLLVTADRTIYCNGVIKFDGSINLTESDNKDKILTLTGVGKILSAKGAINNVSPNSRMMYIKVPSEMLSEVSRVEGGDFILDDVSAAALNIDCTEKMILYITTRPDEVVLNFYTRLSSGDWGNGNMWTLVDGKNILPYFDNAAYWPGYKADWITLDNAIINNAALKINRNPSYARNVTVKSGEVKFNASVQAIFSGDFVINEGAKLNVDVDNVTFSANSLVNNGTLQIAENRYLGVSASVINNNEMKSSKNKAYLVTDCDAFTDNGTNTGIEIVCSGQTYYWKGTSGNWNTVANWFYDAEYTLQASNYPRAEGDNAVIPSGMGVTLNVDNVTLSSIVIEEGATFNPNKKRITLAGDAQSVFAGAITSNGNIRGNAVNFAFTVSEDGDFAFSEQALLDYTTSGGVVELMTRPVEAAKPLKFYANHTAAFDFNANNQNWSIIRAGKVLVYNTVDANWHYPGRQYVRLGYNDIAIIPSGQTVTSKASFTLGGLQIETGGCLNVNGDHIFTSNGDFVFDGNVNITAGKTFTLAGNGKITSLSGTFGSTTAAWAYFRPALSIMSNYLEVDANGALVEKDGDFDFATMCFSSNVVIRFTNSDDIKTFYGFNSELKPGVTNWNTDYLWSVLPNKAVFANVLQPNSNIYNFVVPDGMTITTNGARNIAGLDVQNGGTLIVNGSHTITSLGEIKFDGTVKINDKQTLTLAGNGSVVSAKGMAVINSASPSGNTYVKVSPDMIKSITSYDGATGQFSFDVVNGKAIADFSAQPFGYVNITARPVANDQLLSYYVVSTTAVDWGADAANWSLVPDGKIYVEKQYPKTLYDNAIVGNGKIINLSGNYSLHSLDVQNGSTLRITTESRTLTISENGIVNIDGNLNYTNTDATKTHLIFVGNGGTTNFRVNINDNITCTAANASGLFYIRVPSEAIDYASAGVAKFSDEGGYLLLTTRPADTDTYYPIQANANWKADREWSVLPDAKVCVYLNSTYYYPNRLILGWGQPISDKVVIDNKYVTLNETATVGNVDLINGGTLKLSSNLTFNNLNVGQGTSLVIDADRDVTCNGEIYFDGTLSSTVASKRLNIMFTSEDLAFRQGTHANVGGVTPLLDVTYFSNVDDFNGPLFADLFSKGSYVRVRRHSSGTNTFYTYNTGVAGCNNWYSDKVQNWTLVKGKPVYLYHSKFSSWLGSYYWPGSVAEMSDAVVITSDFNSSFKFNKSYIWQFRGGIESVFLEDGAYLYVADEDNIEVSDKIYGSGTISVQNTLSIKGTLEGVCETACPGTVIYRNKSFYAWQDGTWNKASTWSLSPDEYINPDNDFPGNNKRTGDIVAIPQGVTVSLTDDRTIRSLELNGKIDDSKGKKLTINRDFDGGETGELIVNTLANLAGSGATYYNKFITTGKIGLTQKPDTYYLRNYTEGDKIWDEADWRNWIVTDNLNQNVYYYKNGNWGYVPGSDANDNVVISEGTHIITRQDYTLGNLTVNGYLYLDDGDNGVVMTVNELSGDNKATINILNDQSYVSASDVFKGVGRIICRQETPAGQAFYLLNDGEWNDYTRWSTNESKYVNVDKRYPGSDPNVKNDVAIILGGKNVHIGQNVALAEMKVYGTLDVARTSFIDVANYIDGDGEVYVYDLSYENTNIKLYDNKKNYLFAKGTVHVLAPCIIPEYEFHNLIIGNGVKNGTSECRILGDVHINNNLTVTSNWTLTLGKDIDYKDIKQYTVSGGYVPAFRDLALQGKGFPEELRAFVTVDIDGKLTVEKNAVIQTGWIHPWFTRQLANNHSVADWNYMNLRGDVEIYGRFNMSEIHNDNNPRNRYGEDAQLTKFLAENLCNSVWTNIDGEMQPYGNNVRPSWCCRKAIVSFCGSKDTKFWVYTGGIASVMRFVVRKDVPTAEVFMNNVASEGSDVRGMIFTHCKLASLDSVGTVQHPYELKRGVLHLGDGMVVNGWGSHLSTGGVPSYTPSTTVFWDKSPIALMRFGGRVRTTSVAAMEKYATETVGSTLPDCKIDLSKQIGYTPDSWWLSYGLGKTQTFDVYEMWKAELAASCYIPSEATLWLDGAQVNLGYGRYDIGDFWRNYDDIPDSPNKKTDCSVDYVYVDGALKITNGGKLRLPEKYSLGVIYGNPYGKATAPAQITIEGENSELVTPRIYGLHGRKLNFMLDNGTVTFTGVTNSNSNDPNSYFTTYGGGNIRDGKPQGCTFSMANGGTFSMSGGQIIFENTDNAQWFTDAPSIFDLNNCAGSVTGGEIIFRPTVKDGSVFLGNVALHDVRIQGNITTIATDGRIKFWGVHDGTSANKYGCLGNRITFNGNLTIEDVNGKKPIFITPEYVYVGGNVEINSTAATPLQRLDAATKYPSFVMFGDADVNTFENKVQPNAVRVNDFIIEKSANECEVHIVNSQSMPLNVYGNVHVERGSLTTKDIDFASTGNDRGIRMRNASVIQNLSVGDGGDMSGAYINLYHAKADEGLEGTAHLVIASDLAVGSIVFSNDRIVNMGRNNLKLLNYRNGFAATATKCFASDGSQSAKGLTIPVHNAETYNVGLATLNGKNVEIATTRVTPKQQNDGYLTVSPHNIYHPRVKLEDHNKTVPYYFSTSYAPAENETMLDPGFTYVFNFPVKGITTGNLIGYECVIDNGITAAMKELVNLGATKSSDLVGERMFNVDACGEQGMKNDGDFLVGNGIQAAGITYYSAGSLKWGDARAWTVNEDHVRTSGEPSKYVMTLLDGVHIGAGHIVTTQNYSRLVIGGISIDEDSKLVVYPNTTYSHADVIVDGNGGTLEYRVNKACGSGWETADLDARFDEQNQAINFIKADHSRFLESESATLVFNNVEASDKNYEFCMPKGLPVYPNMVIQGKVTASRNCGPITAASLVVKSGSTMTIDAEDLFAVTGVVTIESGSKLIVKGDARFDGALVNNGEIEICAGGSLNVRSDIKQNGVMNVDGELSFSGFGVSEVSGNQIKFSETAMLGVNKDAKTELVNFKAPLKTTADVFATNFQKGIITIENSQTDISLSNGDRTEFVIPADVTLSAMNGSKLTLKGSNVCSVKLDGTLSVSGGAIVKTTNAIGYGLNADRNAQIATLDIANGTFEASQITSYYEGQGCVNINVNNSSATVNLGRSGYRRVSDATLHVLSGEVFMNNNSSIHIYGSDGQALYYTPTNSRLQQGSSFVIDVNGESSIYTNTTLQGLDVKSGSKVNVVTKPVVFDSSLNIESGAIFNTNGFDITLRGDAKINGSYVHVGNTTYLMGRADQRIDGSAIVDFYNLVVESDHVSTLSVAKAVVENTLVVSRGNLNVEKSAVDVIGTASDRVVLIEPNQVVDGLGIHLCGDKVQTILVQGDVSVLDIDNAAGVNATKQQTYPISITKELRLTNGVLAIGSNGLTLGVDAVVSNGGADEFGEDKMIRTNLSSADNSVSKRVKNGYTGTIALPIGNGDKYTYSEVNIESATVAEIGQFRLIPVDDIYQGVADIKDNVLNFYWRIETSSIDAISGSVDFVCPISDAKGYDPECYETGYVASSSIEWINGHGNVEEQGDNIHLMFPIENSNVGGIYLAGCNLPTQDKAFISYRDGDFAKDPIWYKYDIDNAIVLDETPCEYVAGAAYVIAANTNVSVSTDLLDCSYVEIQKDGVLNLGRTINHSFTIVKGQGRLRVESGSLPSGNYDSFFRQNGGEIEYAGNTDYAVMSQSTTYNLVYFTGTGKRIMPFDKSVDIWGDVYINGSDANLNIETKTNEKENVIRLYNDLHVTKGSVTGTGVFQFYGSEFGPQHIIGESGASKINICGVDVYNNKGVYIDAGADLVVSYKLVLTDGLLYVGGSNNCVSVSNAAESSLVLKNTVGKSYVCGRLSRSMYYNTKSIYPIGTEDRYGYCYLVATAQSTWSAVYHNEKPGLQGTNVDNYDGLKEEYWRISRESGSSNVKVTIRCDEKSDVDPWASSFYVGTLQNNSGWKVYSGSSLTSTGTVLNGEITVEKNFATNSYSQGESKNLLVALGNRRLATIWTGAVSNAWRTANNWAGRVVPSNGATVYISGDCKNNPVITDNVSVSDVYMYDIYTNTNPGKLTIDGGTLVVGGKIWCLNADDDAIVINQRYDKVSNLICSKMCYDGDPEKEFNHVVVNRTFKTNILYYNASATKEGVTSGFDSQYGDLLEWYNVFDESYSKQATGNFYVSGGEFLGHTIGLVSKDKSGNRLDGGIGERTITQVGSIQMDAFTFNLSTSPGAGYSDGWNLVSNPYQCALNLGAKNVISLSGDVMNSVWFRGYDLANKKYYFSSLSITTGVSVAQGSAIGQKNNTIAPQQAFFVLARSNSDKLTFNKPTQSTMAVESGLKSAEFVDDVLRLTISSDEAMADETALVFRDGGSVQQNDGDTYKRFENATYNHIYSLKDGYSNAISLYPEANDVDEEVLPIAVRVSSKSNTAIIKATNLHEFNSSVEVFLRDFETDELVNLRENEEYGFEAQPGQNVVDRFAIVLKSVMSEENGNADDDATEVDKAVVGGIMIVRNENNEAVVCVCQDLLDATAVVRIYDMSGKVITSKNIEGTRTILPLGNSKSLYVVEAVAGGQQKRVKIRTK